MSRPYAEVIGDPIAHSKSPLIHNFWLQKLGIDAEYRACHVRAEELEDYFARKRKDAEWRGCNVTIPHKIAAREYADVLDDEVLKVGAINTLHRAANDLIGANTDVAGILEALPQRYLNAGQEVCIIGTGGAARAALTACQQRNVSLVLLSARDVAAAERLLTEFHFGGSFRPIDDVHNIRTAEVIINATPLGMTGKPPMPQSVLDHLADLMPDVVVLDMVYSPLETPFMRAAAAGGGRVVSGLEMLIGQAATAFEKFFGEQAPRNYDPELRAHLTA